MAGTSNAADIQQAQDANPVETSVTKKIISDISVAQIIASALAAVTAMFFSSQIGLAGSVIGVAASAAVTALSSSVYKSFIEGTKLKAQAQSANNADSSATGAEAAGADAATTTDSDTTAALSMAAEATQANAPLAADITSPVSPYKTTAFPTQAISLDASANGASPATTTEIKGRIYSSDEAAFDAQHAKYTHAAALENDGAISGSFVVLRKRWVAMAILTIIALITVFATAHIINTATEGEGLGTKPAPILVSSSSSASSSAVESSKSASSSAAHSSSSSAAKSSSSASTQSQSANGSHVSSSTSDADGDSATDTSHADSTSKSSSASASTATKSTSANSSTAADGNSGYAGSADTGD